MTDDINNSSAYRKPIIWIDGGMHAREWISTASVMYIIKEMLSPENKRTTKIQKLLKENMIYLCSGFVIRMVMNTHILMTGCGERRDHR